MGGASARAMATMRGGSAPNDSATIGIDGAWSERVEGRGAGSKSRRRRAREERRHAPVRRDPLSKCRSAVSSLPTTSVKPTSFT